MLRIGEIGAPQLLTDIRKSANASWQGVDQREGEFLQINTQPDFLSKADATSTQQYN